MRCSYRERGMSLGVRKGGAGGGRDGGGSGGGCGGGLGGGFPPSFTRALSNVFVARSMDILYVPSMFRVDSWIALDHRVEPWPCLILWRPGLLVDGLCRAVLVSRNGKLPDLCADYSTLTTISGQETPVDKQCYQHRSLWAS